MEEFRKINEVKSYSISNKGNIRNDSTNRILTPSQDKDGYYKVNINNKNCKIHQLVAKYFLNNPENKKCVGHINGIKTDNRIENLRFATKSENNMNCKIYKSNSSGHKGICFFKRTNEWRARISKNGICISIGYFNNIEDAVIARKQKALELFGEFTNDCEQ